MVNKNKNKKLIWTNLPEKWYYIYNKEKIYIKPNERIEYLKKLVGSKKEAAQTYVRNTPIEINTYFRNLIQEELQWFPAIIKNEKLRYYDTKELLYLYNIGGFGILSCINCNAKDQMHFSWRTEKFNLSRSYQCQTCGNLHLLADSDNILKCKCGGILEKNKPIFCRCCDSFKINYKLKIIT